MDRGTRPTPNTNTGTGGGQRRTSRMADEETYRPARIGTALPDEG